MIGKRGYVLFEGLDYKEVVVKSNDRQRKQIIKCISEVKADKGVEVLTLYRIEYFKRDVIGILSWYQKVRFSLKDAIGVYKQV
jgi:hypothetical protein